MQSASHFVNRLTQAKNSLKCYFKYQEIGTGMKQTTKINMESQPKNF